MSEIKNYADWQAAVEAECDKLRAVDRYLNEAGKERKDVMATLLDLADYCDTAAELLAWIESRKDMSRYYIQWLDSHHARVAIRKLRGLVK